ncbi:MAG: phosphatase PAP2 family protein [Pseudomonadota bacterium]
MKRPTFFTAIVLIASTSLSASAFSQDSSPGYLPEGSIDAAALIGPPPAIGSEVFDQQMAIVLWLQETRIPEQVAFVEQTLDQTRFVPLLGDALLQADGRQLNQMIDDVIDEVRADYDALKDVYDLPRPFQVNEAVEPVGDARPVASYPSGHAIRATVYARLLAEIFPDHEAALMDLADRIAHGRVIAGVHYPIDVVSGQELGNAYADIIIAQPTFADAVDDILGSQSEGG